MRILHINNIANIAYQLSRGQRELGYRADVLAIRKPARFPCDIEIVLDEERTPITGPGDLAKAQRRQFKVVQQNIKNYGVIHIHGGLGFTGLYYLLYKLTHGKNNPNFFIHYHGSGLRSNQKTKFHKIADKLFISTPDLLRYRMNVSGRELIHIPNPYDLSEIKFRPKALGSEFVARDVIKIAHLPSRRNVKGTKNIIRAVRALDDKYNIELVLIENQPHKKAMRMLEGCDLCIDWVSKDYDIYGMVSVEAMARGIPTLCKYNREYYRRPAPPIVNTTPDTLQNDLITLLEDKHKWHELSIKGREYVEQVHAPINVAKKVCAIYEEVRNKS